MVVSPSYGSTLSPLLSKDNIHIKDKRPAPSVSIIQKFCIQVTRSRHLGILYLLVVDCTIMTKSHFGSKRLTRGGGGGDYECLAGPTDQCLPAIPGLHVYNIFTCIIYMYRPATSI